MTHPSGKIEAGHAKAPLWLLAAGWHAYKLGAFGKAGCVGMRAFLGLIKLDDKRRLARQRSLPPREEIVEFLSGFTGASARHLTSSLRTFVELGLVVDDEAGIRLASSLPESFDTDAFRDFLGELGKSGNRLVTIPHRILSMLGMKSRAALIARAMAIYIRGHFDRKDGTTNTVGRIAESWVASTFGISQQSSEDARKELIDLGVFSVREVARQGTRFEINPEWVGDRPKAPCAGLPPHPTPKSAGLPPPSIKQFPLRITGEIRKPNPQPAIGFSIEDRKIGKPNLLRLVIEDLREEVRLRAIYDQAVAANMIRPSEHNWVKFRAEARHALAVGKDPLALFFSNVSKRRFYATGRDEDAVPSRAAPPPPRPVRSDPPSTPRRRRPEPSPEDVWSGLATKPGPIGDMARRELAKVQASPAGSVVRSERFAGDRS